MDSGKFIAQAKQLGLEGTELRAWVKEQQGQAREEQASSLSNYGKKGHPAYECPSGSNALQPSCLYAPQAQHRDPIRDGYIELRNGDKVPVVNAMRVTQPRCHAENLPVVSKALRGTDISVLRDTVCNTVIARRDLVREDELTGTSKLVYVVDGTAKMLPEVSIEVQTPYLDALLQKTPTTTMATKVESRTTATKPAQVSEEESMDFASQSPMNDFKGIAPWRPRTPTLIFPPQGRLTAQMRSDTRGNRQRSGTYGEEDSSPRTASFQQITSQNAGVGLGRKIRMGVRTRRDPQELLKDPHAIAEPHGVRTTRTARSKIDVHAKTNYTREDETVGPSENQPTEQERPQSTGVTSCQLDEAANLETFRSRIVDLNETSYMRGISGGGSQRVFIKEDLVTRF
ncbi:hypothetical protein HPB50_002998 [Hyalomma asiaticum]|uniref:Uncharacterized protein n=1 Tax=Hyalomma asiaticum TaxID=266040 RepID=A0ACB7T0Y2_HYAAI|nr:hypothetical protein HPB50_002998 [Hyalomma asiaticum]